MFRFLMDLVATLVVVGMVYFGSSSVISHIRKESTKQVKSGLLPSYKFTQALTGKKLDWEKMQ